MWAGSSGPALFLGALGYTADTPLVRRGGETGRRTGLKIPGPQGRVGSIPTPGTNLLAITTVAEVAATVAPRHGLRVIPF